jgi:hypothetical protein
VAVPSAMAYIHISVVLHKFNRSAVRRNDNLQHASNRTIMGKP